MPSHLSPGALTALLLHTGLRFICIPSILLDIHIFYSFVVARDRPPYVLWLVALLPLMPLGLAVSINVLGRSFGGPVIAADAILLPEARVRPNAKFWLNFNPSSPTLGAPISGRLRYKLLQDRRLAIVMSTVLVLLCIATLVHIAYQSALYSTARGNIPRCDWYVVVSSCLKLISNMFGLS